MEEKYNPLVQKINVEYVNKGKMKQFASDLGMTYTNLRYKITGVSDFSLAQVHKIAEILNLTKEEIFNIFFVEFTTSK